MTLHTPYRVVLCLVAAALIAQSAHAYGWATCNGNKKKWSSNNVTFHPSSADFPYGSSWRYSIESAKNAWNNAPGTQFDFSYSYTSSTGYTSGDSVNSIVRSSSYGWSTGQLGVALTRYSLCLVPFFTGGISEVDVLYNDTLTWNHGKNPNPSNLGTNSVLVGMHELGHAMGLMHSNGTLATMNASYPGGGTIGRHNDVEPHGDDVLGNRAGYGTSGSPRDVYASVFQRTGASGSSVIPAPTDMYRNQPTFFSFTIGNRGAVNENFVKVSFYLSTDNSISTGDHLIGSAFFAMSQGSARTYELVFPVPGSISAGNYFLGWIIDPDQHIPETDEGNNQVAMTTTTTLH